MKLKTNLHFHTSDDPVDIVGYSLQQGIDHASSLGFEVIALTCHEQFKWTQEYAEYAKSKDIILIPGIEINIKEKEDKKGRHLIILNCDKDTENIKDFEDLKKYKKEHSQTFVIAPHPYFYGGISLKEYLEQYIGLFDAIEHSWFYSKIFNRNKKAELVAKKYNKPFIATSDTHYFSNTFNENYALIEVEEKNIESVLQAIRENRFENITSPRKFFTEMFFPQLKFMIENFFKKKFYRK